MDIVERLIAYRNYTGYTNSQFADLANIPRPTLSQFLNGRNKRLSDDMTSKLHQAFPDLNILWLLFGEGDMLTDQNIKISEANIDENSDFFITDIPDYKESNVSKSVSENLTDSQANRKNQANSFKKNGEDPFETLKHEDFNENEGANFFAGQSCQKMSEAPVVPTDPSKRIKSIMVFYSDNSYEIFTPNSNK